MKDRETEIARKQLRAEVLTRVTVYLIGVTIVLLLGFIAYDTWLSSTQRDTLLDCTQDQGKCFQRSETQMQDAITKVLRGQEARARITREVVIYASYCAKLSKNQTVRGVERCVQNLLDTQHKVTVVPKSR